MKTVFVMSLAVFAAAPSMAQESDREMRDRARYEACLEAVEANPEEGYEDGLAWRYEGGGWPARHCIARALIALGDEAEGAFRLQALAEAPDGGPTAMKVLYLAEAGQAWMTIGEAGEAHRAYSRALELSPNSAPLWVARASAASEMEEWASVEADAAQAIAADPGNHEGWRTRAAARLELGDLDAAESDMRRARQIAPTDIDTLVIRGRINEARRAER